MKELEFELKKMLIEALDVEGIAADDIDSAAPLFAKGPGLDCLDALDLEMPPRCGIQSDAGDESPREHFSTVANPALLVSSTLNKGA